MIQGILQKTIKRIVNEFFMEVKQGNCEINDLPALRKMIDKEEKELSEMDFLSLRAFGSSLLMFIINRGLTIEAYFNALPVVGKIETTEIDSPEYQKAIEGCLVFSKNGVHIPFKR